jgi:sarcosine oxidase gamma subunit
MFDRSGFWSPVPGWIGAVLESEGFRIAAVAPAAIWRLSANVAPVLQRLGIDRTLGPRDACDAACYALRIAPDSVLAVCESEPTVALEPGWTADGAAQSEMNDGIVCIDIRGPRAAELMSLASEYPFTAAPGPQRESARMLFAGLRVAVMRRADGWRLHVERPWAPALWHWLAAHALTGSGLES